MSDESWFITKRSDTSEVNREDELNVTSGCKIHGKFEFRGRGRFDGQVDGEVIAIGELELGPNAVMNAKITADRLIVSGTVNGNIICRERLEIRQGARVHGDVSTPKLVLEEGVEFEGFCTMPTAPEDSRRAEDPQIAPGFAKIENA